MSKSSMSPLKLAIAYVVVYLLLTAALTAINFAGGASEFRWSRTWPIWALAFAPVALTSIMAAAFTAPGKRPLRILLPGSLIATAAAMQACFLLAKTTAGIFAVVIALCFAIAGAFKAATPRD